jgi:DNA-binding NarL/FixJ family response regulator
VNETILMVEDEDDTREMLGRALVRAGYRCVLARDQADALDKASRSGAIDLVVADIVLGNDERAGLCLLGALKKLDVRAPVIIITAYADVEKVKTALNEGAVHLLEKPFAAPTLISAVERVLREGTTSQKTVEQALSLVSLTEKERVVARHLLEGLSSIEIAELEHNSPKTIRQHVSQIYSKCGVNSRAEFFRWVYGR